MADLHAGSRSTTGTRRIVAGVMAAGVLALTLLGTVGSAFAEDTRPIEERVADLEAYMNNVAPKGTPIPGPGHNAWMMTSAALVLFMTLPGLALFYGGLVRRKNILSVCAQCLGITGLVTILWWVCGYSLVFADGGGKFLGSLKYAFFNGVD